jgi:hypothetical protein
LRHILGGLATVGAKGAEGNGDGDATPAWELAPYEEKKRHVSIETPRENNNAMWAQKRHVRVITPCENNNAMWEGVLSSCSWLSEVCPSLCKMVLSLNEAECAIKRLLASPAAAAAPHPSCQVDCSCW